MLASLFQTAHNYPGIAPFIPLLIGSTAGLLVWVTFGRRRG
jgi:hypothetical protein